MLYLNRLHKIMRNKNKIKTKFGHLKLTRSYDFWGKVLRYLQNFKNFYALKYTRSKI